VAQTVEVAGKRFTLQSDETIWTESCHKYAPHDARAMANRTGFECVAQWVDDEWPFAESLCKAV